MPGSSLPSHDGSGDRRSAGDGRTPGPPRRARTRRDGGDGRRLETVHEVSAGGLVVDGFAGSVQAALIARTDRRGRLEWVLPKGHVEVGETATDAAVREVREETGLVARVIAPLGDIDYWFVAGHRRIHKTVHHYLLLVTGGDFDTTDVEVTDVAWVPVDDLVGRLRYSSERRLMDRLPDLLASAADTGSR